MKNVRNHNDYIVDLLLENVIENGELPFALSDKLSTILYDMKHPISKEILDLTGINKPVTLVDISDENDKVTLVNSPKMVDFLSQFYDNSPFINIDNSRKFYRYKAHSDDIWTKYRYIIKIGKLVKKLFGDKFPENGVPGKDIESFVNEYKSVYERYYGIELFDIVEGNDIIKWYSTRNYASDDEDSVLHNSCMNDEREFLKFYADNNVKMLILYENDKKERIVGRALLWTLDEPKDRMFLDRIYTIYDHQVDQFKMYAIKNKWFYKNKQRYGNENIIDPIDNTMSDRDFEVHNINLERYYPYLDTLRYLDQDDRKLSSEPISDIKLNSTEGGADGSEWSDRYQRYINMNKVCDQCKYVLCNIGVDTYYDEIENVYLKSDAVYLPNYDEYIPKNLYDDKVVKVTIGGEGDYLKKDCLYLKYYKGWATYRYTRYMDYSDYYTDYFYEHDVVFSKKYGLINKNTSTTVYNKDLNGYDYVPNEELNKVARVKNGKYVFK